MKSFSRIKSFAFATGLFGLIAFAAMASSGLSDDKAAATDKDAAKNAASNKNSSDKNETGKGESEKSESGKTGLTNPLAVRIMNYGKVQDDAWTHLPSLGVHYIFLNIPVPDQIPAFQQRLAKSKLHPLVFRGDADLGRDSSVKDLISQIAVCEKMGVKYLFLSPKHSGVSKQVAYERLRKVGDAAEKKGVIVVLETHPDLCANTVAQRETMKAVNHPNVRLNYDTGNISYYNKGGDALNELKKVIEFVATVELKDHSGKYMAWEFPTLGKGVVDFPGILKFLEERHFDGPITIEVEGVQGQEMTQTELKQCIADSVKYIQSLGNFK
jgi:L-ribulose-5-phosphate 3-epimerase